MKIGEYVAGVIYRLWLRAESRRRHEQWFRRAVANETVRQAKLERGVKSVPFTDGRPMITFTHPRIRRLRWKLYRALRRSPRALWVLGPCPTCGGSSRCPRCGSCIYNCPPCHP